MFKFAFVINMPGYTPETYSTVWQDENEYNFVAGVDGIEAGKEFVKKLASEGYELFNLCGDFDTEVTAEIQNAVGESAEVECSKYTEAEAAKLGALEVLQNYGIIILVEGADGIEEAYLESPDCNTTVMFVKDMENAKLAAAELVEKGIDFIELCSWFDEEKLNEIIAATENKVPVGTCAAL